ncbi:FMN-binding protein [Bacillus sp. AFS088145]|uniref:FMN-binding protein n=1 Tax=Bacillus sp. AFS088145 TaxID=2033514 RepID=UPI000BF2B6FF|nr:FMN-binding protein [Bacillus sp. AFS088145]PFH87239.1 FMN-binding protein [Bacillus sp. AFS088145]
MGKMSKKWVTICSTAIGAIYATGYFTTDIQDSNVASPKTEQVNLPLNKNNIVKKSFYKNGTFYGMASNRRGSIQIALKINEDKIIDVEISNYGMHYSEDDIVNLPNEVVNVQSSQVRNVSGATYSTQAFKDAIQDALLKARNI